MEIILVRHGETFANTKDVIQGQLHGKLTDKGRQQVLVLAKKMKNIELDAIFSSDLRRSSETANIIAEQHNIPIYRFKWLRGRDSGIYEGRRWDSVIAKVGHKRAFEDINFKFGGGESLVDMRERLSKFIDGIIKNYNGTVLICTHRHCLSMLLCIIFDVPLDEMLSKLKNVRNAQIVGNAETIEIQVENGVPRYLGNNKTVKYILAA